MRTATRKTRVNWTEAERERLITELSSAIMSHPTEGISTIADRLVAHWPEDRRRKINTTADKWLVQGVQKHLHKMKEELHELRNKPVAPPVVPVPPPAPLVQTREEIIESLTAKELIAVFATKLCDLIEEGNEINRVNQELLHRILSRSHVGEPANGNGHGKTLKPHLVVIGFRPGNKEDITKKFGEKARFTFIDGFKSDKTLPVADHYFVMADHCRHAWVYVVKDRSKLQLITGSLSALEAALEYHLR